MNKRKRDKVKKTKDYSIIVTNNYSIIYSTKKFPMAIKLEEGGRGKTLMAWP